MAAYDYEQRRLQALQSAGGNESSPLYQNWINTYGQGTAGYTPGAVVTPTATDPSTLLPQYYQSVSTGLRGELPPDVMNLLAQQAAERGVSSGLAGSQAAQYAGLRNLRDVALQQISNNQRLAAPLVDTAQKQQFQTQEIDYRNRQLAQQKQIADEQIAANAQMTREGRAMSNAPTATRPSASADVARTYLGPTPTYGSAGSPWGTGSTAQDITGDFSQWPTSSNLSSDNLYNDFLDAWNVGDYGALQNDLSGGSYDNSLGSPQDWGWDYFGG